MKLGNEILNQIEQKVRQVENTEQLANLLQLIYDSIYPNPRKRVLIKGGHLTYYAFKNKERYVSFEIPKKNGSNRKISAPRYKLKTIQRCLNILFNTLFTPHRAAFGFVQGKSVTDNAQHHIGKRFVYNIDLANFFPSVNFRRVKTMLQLEPFSFNDKMAFLIANLCCENGVLPQGAPTSPTLTNVVSQRLDRKLSKLARRYKSNYTRYADDITFSSFKDCFSSDFRNELLKIIKEENFDFNPDKERLQDHKVRQEVTGIVVNKKSNVNRFYIKDVRYWLRTWKEFGPEKTQIDFSKRYKTKKGVAKRKGIVPPFENYLHGKILYLGMVRGSNDSMFRKFLVEYELMSTAFVNGSASQYKSDVIEILDIWKEQGIEEAIKQFMNPEKGDDQNDEQN